MFLRIPTLLQIKNKKRKPREVLNLWVSQQRPVGVQKTFNNILRVEATKNHKRKPREVVDLWTSQQRSTQVQASFYTHAINTSTSL